ncbi:hypothetical protein BGAL_0065g00050 [Botrytis galanthina]|uniref:SMP-30/Gluconolactonase/LRE-like region domain-containing protein n=1 Tax=Botrytis galanthina TaxID=278940 RepID=A0A4S8R4L7_9HELO|nr:hypothetical protein BGAL_0065g00050 [Botrytis galanthina]
MRQSIFASLGLTLVLGLQVAAEFPVRTVYQFASNDTWLENPVVRSDGFILATEIGPPARLLAFDPTQEYPEKQVVATFANVLGLTGITESAHNVFYITGANTTSATIRDPPKNATQVWRVDYSGNTTEPVITHIASPTYPTIIDFNGLAAYDESIILASASHDNAIAAIDVETGRTWVAFEDDSMSNINGIKIQDDYIYWTAGSNFCRAELYSNFTISIAEVIALGLEDGSSLNFDDFALSPNGWKTNQTNSEGRKYAYLTTSVNNSIMEISFDAKTGGNNETAIIAGALYSTEIAEPTGVAFGRAQGQINKLYVTTGGGSGMNVDVDGVETAVGAQLLEITLT